ncbi:MAG: imidazoleglycerol-phosphate dehydratase HisB [Bacillota bacterium]
MRACDERKTTETEVRVCWETDGSGAPDIDTGVPFFDHMLEAMAFHGGFDLDISARGDVEIDAHHLAEDVGIVLGRVLSDGRPKEPARFGWTVVPMDEAAVMISLDFGGRSFLSYGMDPPPRQFGSFHTENAEDFLRALTDNAGMTLHVQQMAGHNAHHILEACFKALGLALRTAVGEHPDGAASTKGSLERPR